VTNGVHPELATALDELYRAFADYPAPRWVEACACCHEPEEGSPPHPERLIIMVSAPGVGTPLREISAAELKWFADDAPIVAGSDADWKHYLPRILELTILDEEEV
jgi:hypothetical protein